MSKLSPAPEGDAAVCQLLLESTNAIPWKIDWASKQFSYIEPQIERLLGWEQSSWKNVQDWADRMHPEDRDWVVEYCVSQSSAGVDHEADYRALTRSGSYVWIRDVAHVVRSEGRTEALVGFMFDVTERKQAEDDAFDALPFAEAKRRGARALLEGLAPHSGVFATRLAAHLEPNRPTTEAKLSPREHELLHLLAAGMSLSECGTNMNVSSETVKTMGKRIRQKLHAGSTSEAIGVAFRTGILK
jgi:PAS domain S-box-containing protein